MQSNKYQTFSFFCRMNRLKSLGRGFGACPSLEVLDITHNKMSEEGLPGNFWMMGKSKCHSSVIVASYMRTSYALTLAFYFHARNPSCLVYGRQLLRDFVSRDSSTSQFTDCKIATISHLSCLPISNRQELSSA
jgi:hypothetical protein